VQDVLTKVYGSTSAKNVVKATLNGLIKLRSKEIVESLRGVNIEIK
jgi:small subunit ribosomal protein S5